MQSLGGLEDGDVAVGGLCTIPLAATELFKPLHQNSSRKEHLQIAYRRAQATAGAYDMSPEDIVFLTQKFRDFHMDLIAAIDGAAFTLLTIQWNLAAGTLAPFALKRPELRPLLKQIIDFEVSAQFLLSEVEHGLDSPNLETTATLLPNGEFDLHTPHVGAAKHMPPTGPMGNMPRVAIVVARLIVGAEDRGVRPFIVALGNGDEMCKGITARLLPDRAGSHPIDHALTYFSHVRLPTSALLGKLEKPANVRQSFIKTIWRVGVGSLALSTSCIPVMKVCVYVAGKYSLRRNVTGPTNKPTPIISFRTQQLPILHTLAQIKVLEAYADSAWEQFMDPGLSSDVRHGIATCLKAVMIQHLQASLYQLAERCGAQGLYEHNMIIQLQLEMRGVSIAEGDVLALCIRLASELLIGRYTMPPTGDPTSYIARHEMGLFKECRDMMASFRNNHRDENYNRHILPLCQPLIEAIGHRMAYDAAVKAGVDANLIRLYVSGIIKHDASWYAEHSIVGRASQRDMEERAITALLPQLESLLEGLGAAPYCTAPIATQESFKNFVDNLPLFTGNANVPLIRTEMPQSSGLSSMTTGAPMARM